MRNDLIIFKSTAGDGIVKDVDQSKRIVTGYYSSFGSDQNIDSDGDVMGMNAFDNTLKMNGPGGANRIWHLFNHSQSSPINKPTVLKVDSFGLYFETRFPDTTLGNDMLTLYQEGAITEHSIGFNVIQSRQEKTISGEYYQLIQEVRLWEGSSVLWGANEKTPVVGIKSMDFEVKAKLLDNILHNGDLSDEMFVQIEKMLHEIKNIFRTPDKTDPEKKAVTGITEAERIKQFYSQLTQKKL